MKRRLFLICFLLLLFAEVIVLVIFAVRTPDFTQNTIEVNEVVQSVTADFDSFDEHKNRTTLDYVVLNNDGEVLYRTKSGLSESLNEAVTHRDTILDVTKNDRTVGKVIVYNDGAQTLQSQKQIAITVLIVAIVLQCGIGVGYAFYAYFTIVRPFNKLKGFAERIAGGNLGVPLEMDRHNLFGAFTESFDIMRS